MEDIPKSHLKFNEFAHELEALDTVGISEEVKWKAENDYLQDFFGHSIDEFGKPYYMKHITAPRGSLIQEPFTGISIQLRIGPIAIVQK